MQRCFLRQMTTTRDAVSLHEALAAALGVLVLASFVLSGCGERLPEYYGLYEDDGKAFHLLKTSGTMREASPSANFLFYGKQVAGIPATVKAYTLCLDAMQPGSQSIGERSETSVAKASQELLSSIVAITGVPKGSVPVELMVKPVEGHPEVVRLSPSTPLGPGVYQIETWGRFCVGKAQVVPQVVISVQGALESGNATRAKDLLAILSAVAPEDTRAHDISTAVESHERKLAFERTLSERNYAGAARLLSTGDVKSRQSFETVLCGLEPKRDVLLGLLTGTRSHDTEQSAAASALIAVLVNTREGLKACAAIADDAGDWESSRLAARFVLEAGGSDAAKEPEVQAMLMRRRRDACLSHRTGIDKGVGVWESQKTALTKQARVSITFDGFGNILATTGPLPPGLNAEANKRAIADYIRDDEIFLCPEWTARNPNGQRGGSKALSVKDRSAPQYMWVCGPDSSETLNNNRRGVVCLSYGWKDGKPVPGADGSDATSHK